MLVSQNSATGAEGAPGEGCSSVEMGAPVEKEAPVENSEPVGIIATVEELVDALRGAEFRSPSRPNSAPVAKNATGEQFATGELAATDRGQRILRRRPIVRVTDGLTPGQYAVYSLMYEAGEGAGSVRIYRGGYADLRRLTGLSKRGIQNIMGELQSKHVIRIHQKPGYHRTETSAYEVPDPQTVIGIWRSQGWNCAVGKSKTLTG